MKRIVWALILCIGMGIGQTCKAEEFKDLANLFNSMANLLEAGTDLIEAENNLNKSTEKIEKKTFSGKTVKVKIGLKSYDVHQECIDTMKKYEEFFDKYIEVINDSTVDTSEYISFMSQYAEMMAEFEKYEDYDLSEGDELYYLEILHRVNMKLLTSY